MSAKRNATIQYYEGVKASLAQMVQDTEAIVLKLTELKGADAEKVIKSVRKKHERLLARIDRNLASERAKGARR
jgi:hypothetical protein